MKNMWVVVGVSSGIQTLKEIGSISANSEHVLLGLKDLLQGLRNPPVIVIDRKLYKVFSVTGLDGTDRPFA